MRAAARRLFAAVALLAAALLGCLEDPVDSRLVLTFLADGKVEIRAEVSVPLLDPDEPNAPLERRVRELREALQGGWDEWTPRFERVTAATESVTWEKEEGVLVLYARTVRLDEPDDLRRFFTDTDLSVFYGVEPGLATLEIYPSASNRATRRQRQRVEQALAGWLEDLGAYFAAGEKLYRYLETRPGRAAACLGNLMEDVVEGKVEPLTEEEEALVGAVAQAMETSWQVLLVEPGEAYSLSELSQLVYDPFPADFVAVTPEPATEAEGFDQEEETLTVRRMGLWESLGALEGRFLRPDPLLLYVRHARADRALDLDEMVATPRHAEPVVRRDELRKAIEERLTPSPAYRATWPLEP